MLSGCEGGAANCGSAEIWVILPGLGAIFPTPRTALIHGDCAEMLARFPDDSIHAIVTDPPFSPLEYGAKNVEKLREGKGGVWRKPPILGGCARAPLPRFTVLSAADRERFSGFMFEIAAISLRKLRPGGHAFVAATPLLAAAAFSAWERAGFEPRGQIIRLARTLRGGDRPKGAEAEFAGVSAMARGCFEPWGLFRRPLSERTVAANLRRWDTGGLRRISAEQPFADVIASAPAGKRERLIASHPSIKPQAFMRSVVLASLPLGKGVIVDPFAGSGSTLAAAEALGLACVGIERDPEYAAMAARAIPLLAAL